MEIVLPVRTFEFYLDAWAYAKAHNIPSINIVKTGFKEWTVKE